MTAATKSQPSFEFGKLRRAVQTTLTTIRFGKLAGANGTLLKATGLHASIGELCLLTNPGSDWELQAEVVGISDGYTLLTPLGSLQGVSSATRVSALGDQPKVNVGEALLGRVLDGHGQPLDGLAPPDCRHTVPLYTPAPDPLSRQAITRPLTTGVRAIDSLLTAGVGQRVGVFAVAGCGKSVLLGMLARGCAADVNVIALVGERGREVGEFVRDNLQGSLQKSVVIVATSDRPPLERARALYSATAIAEHFREQGKNVLFLADSVTRFARALRDVGLAAGEPPTRRGFPPSVFSELPRVMERTGNSASGSISAFYTVLMEDEETSDPIAEEVRSILDGHIILSSKLAGQNHYPAIDISSSSSRVMGRLVSEAHVRDAGQARKLLAKHDDVELLVQVGEYEPGRDPEADAALNAAPLLAKHLCQSPDEKVDFQASRKSLAEICASCVPN